MNTQELIDLVRKYPEWEDDLDPTACATGFVTCVICGGGGWTGDKRKKYPSPAHSLGCLRAKFEKEYGECQRSSGE